MKNGASGAITIPHAQCALRDASRVGMAVRRADRAGAHWGSTHTRVMSRHFAARD